MLGQLGLKVNKAMAFYIKELLLTILLTGCDWPGLANQTYVVGNGMNINPNNAPFDPGVFTK